MPICTSCTHPVLSLYTVYQSAYNLRLEQCPNCREFVDPYVEHDTLTLLLDLILLKRGVYRHLLFNRGTKPRKAVEISEHKNPNELTGSGEWARWKTTMKLGLLLVAVDAFIRWSYFHPLTASHTGDEPQTFSQSSTPWTSEAGRSFARIFVGCLIETIAFHTGVLTACAVVLPTLDWSRTYLSKWKSKSTSETVVHGTRLEFRLSHVPLTLFYSSITKLFLLLLLSIWRPEVQHNVKPTSGHLDEVIGFLQHPTLRWALEILDEDKLDREWAVRNVLGGMAAGFGLRVVLDCHPIFTTIIILSGWLVKTWVADVVGEWVGGSTEIDLKERWLAYSIP